MRSKTNLKGSIMLLIAAMIWGTAFIAQEEAAALGVETFTMNGIRFTLGGMALIPLIIYISRKNKGTGLSAPLLNKTTVTGGIICGLALSVAANLQQFGITFNAAEAEGDSGKAGFITALYLVLVPIINYVFRGRKLSLSLIIGILFALLGMYFISVKSGFKIATGDIFLLLCAFGYAMQIVFVDIWINKVNGVVLSAVQFFVTGAVSFILMFIFEKPDIKSVFSAAIPILYCAVMSSGVAFTLQALAQRYCEPALASIIMSLESLFCMITACIFYSKLPALREIAGGILMMIAIFFVETPYFDMALIKLSKKRKHERV